MVIDKPSCRRLGFAERSSTLSNTTRQGGGGPPRHLLRFRFHHHRATSFGKAILAFQPRQLIEDLLSESLPKLTKRTPSAAALRRELETIRAAGIATERDEAILGESSLAAPIFDHAAHAVGAIGVVGETERILPRGPAKGLSAAVAEAARGVSRELGAARWPYIA